MLKRITERAFPSSLYWHGDKVKDFSIDKSAYNVFFITPKFEYAISYSRDPESGHWQYMYQIEIEKDLNIFDANDDVDSRTLYMYLRKHGVPMEKAGEVIRRLKKTDWLKGFSLNDRNKIFKMLQILKFDGFYNIESDQENLYEDNNPTIGIFDMRNVHIVQILEGDGINHYIENNKDLLKIKQTQIEDYKEGLYVESLPSLLTYEELDELDKELEND